MYVIKAEVPDAAVPTFRFERAKTMYGGKRVAVGDTVFVFASENEGGRGLVASGVATVAEALPRLPGVARQTCPRHHTVPFNWDAEPGIDFGGGAVGVAPQVLQFPVAFPDELVRAHRRQPGWRGGGPAPHEERTQLREE